MWGKPSLAKIQGNAVKKKLPKENQEKHIVMCFHCSLVFLLPFLVFAMFCKFSFSNALGVFWVAWGGIGGCLGVCWKYVGNTWGDS